MNTYKRERFEKRHAAGIAMRNIAQASARQHVRDALPLLGTYNDEANDHALAAWDLTGRTVNQIAAELHARN